MRNLIAYEVLKARKLKLSQTWFGWKWVSRFPYYAESGRTFVTAADAYADAWQSLIAEPETRGSLVFNLSPYLSHKKLFNRIEIRLLAGKYRIVDATYFDYELTGIAVLEELVCGIKTAQAIAQDYQNCFSTIAKGSLKRLNETPVDDLSRYMRRATWVGTNGAVLKLIA